MKRLLGLEGLRLTERGESVRDYLAAAASLGCIAVILISSYLALKMIGF
jgi:hypothetical protein